MMVRIPFRARLVALTALVPIAAWPSASTIQDPGQESTRAIEELTRKLKAVTDAADPALIQELAGKHTRAAMEALLDVYTAMNTPYMHREIVRALVQFDGVADAEQPALQKLMDVATQAPEPELRQAALDGLGQCHSHGKDFLRLIVDSQAESSVREYAMELHVTLADKSDLSWYRELYKPKSDEKTEKDKEKKGGKKKEAVDTASRPKGPLDSIRARAFDPLAKDLTPEEIVEATGDSYFKIRMAALLELERRGDKRALELAQAAFEKSSPPDSAHMVMKVNERVEVRVVAAQIFARLSGLKAAPELIKRATNVETPMELQRTLAEILAGFNDPALNRQLLGDLGKGRRHEKLFRLWVLSQLHDEKIDKAIENLLSDKDDDVVIAACAVLASRKDGSAIPLLQKLAKGKDRGVLPSALEAMTALRRGDKTWIDEVIVLAKSEDPELRNLALKALSQIAEKEALPRLIEALQDKNWTTRLTALKGLESLKVKEAIPAIIERMGQEDGRMLVEFSDTLFRLTGQFYRDHVQDWQSWWKQNGEGFQILTEQQVERAQTIQRDSWLKQGTRVEQDPRLHPDATQKQSPIEPKFFGIRVISHRVIFILDVSGSMNEDLHSAYEGKTGRTRMEVARRELQKCVQSLDTAAFFNFISFSDGVTRWREGSLAAASSKNREDFQVYLAKLGALGGTNLYGALKAGFADPDVDTIYVMSDGEPSVGEEIDQVTIREHVKQWNANRGIVIHTIAVGGQYPILEWLAEDSGGSRVRFE